MEIFLDCPHCGGMVEIEQINCGIFRHGIFKTGEQIPPHDQKKEYADSIWGCGKPFKYEHGKLIECDYI
jgi:hypothetical protein